MSYSKKVFPDLTTIHVRGIVPSYTWEPGWPAAHVQFAGGDCSFIDVEESHKDIAERYYADAFRRVTTILDRVSGRDIPDDERREVIAELEQLREGVRSPQKAKV